ncbi:MAG: hypothetical protein IPG55_05100 [Saprospiraceae bacterium]|nr:hypothetical protein [Candidatus Defluviibacterium haderslevense]
MKFTELRNTMQSFSGASTPDYQLAYITSEVKDLMDGLNNKFVEFLTRDITEGKFQFDIQLWLGSPYYQSSNENAKDCLESCPSVNHIWGRKIKSWTDSALKCFDNFLLKYLQIDMGETIPKTYSGLKETDVYKHLIEKGGIEQEVGQNFTNIYQLRSSFQHIQTEEKGGLRIPKRISNSQCNKSRDLIVHWFRVSLIAFLILLEQQKNNNNQRD